LPGLFVQERLRLLIEERKHLINENWQANTDPRAMLRRNDSSADPRSSSAMVEKERQRLEVLKRRQEKELQQMVQYEITRKELLEKQQKRVEEQERRAMEQARLKIQHEAARMAKQREIELQKMAEEKEMERRARVMAEERYRHEKRMQFEREATERQLRQRAYQDEMERRHKAEEARRETEAILEAQAEEVRLRKVEMEKRDAERIKRMEQELKEKHAANMLKRKKAEERINQALEHNAQLMRMKRAAYEQKEAEAEARRKELEAIHAREEAHKKEEEHRKHLERQEKYAAALETEEMRKMSVKERAAEKERLLAELNARRKKENDLRKVDSDFQLKLRLDKVDCIQKMSLYNRQQLLERIMNDYDKTRELLRERQNLQMQRKMANMNASLQRQMMSKAMDSLRFTKNVDSLSTNGGSVNINDLLSRTRPSTAL